MSPPSTSRRVQADRALRFVVLVFSSYIFIFALYLAWLAFSNPLELEIREGTVWIHVLAKRAGVDIYDTTRVAFVNMNHGPLDPILKTWISRCLPWLPGSMVTRVFVLLTPIFLFGSAYTISRRRLAVSLLAAGTLFLFFCHVSIMMLVGRSDATAICGLCVCGVLAHRLVGTGSINWKDRAHTLKQFGLGAASSAVFLISSRYVPIAAALQFVVLVAQIAGSAARHDPPTRSPLGRLGSAAKQLAISTVLYSAGFVIVWLLVFFFELHGNYPSYYRHFFGFFSAKSGWGTSEGAGGFHLLPSELCANRRGPILLGLALILGALYRLRRQPGQLMAWLAMLTAAWVVVSYGYFKNQSGGGLHYFFEFFTFAWIFLLQAFSRPDPGPTRARLWSLAPLLLVCGVALTLPWRDLFAEQKMLTVARTNARSFQRQVSQLTHGQPVFGEETHLFKTTYAGEVVDTGDSVAVIAASGYFGAALSRTYEAYRLQLISYPPKFVLVGLLDEANRGGVMTPPLRDLLQHRYTLRLIDRGSSIVNGGAEALFERND